MNSDVFLATGALGFCLAAAVIVFVLVEGALEKRKRPYLAARWDEAAKDWANEAEHDVGPDPLKALDDITAHLKAYGAEIADLYEPVHTGDHTTTNPTGDQT